MNRERPRFLLLLAFSLIVVWLAAYFWQNPGVLGARITAAEIDRYMQGLETIPFKAEDRPEMLRRMRAWMEADDGRPVYMLNLMRYYPRIQAFPGAPSDFHGTPQESNAIYEAAATKYLLYVGGYPIFGGNQSGRNIVEYQGDKDDWSRTLMIRYPSRRAVMEHFCRPGFQAVEPYKLMALSVILSPTAAEVVLPELHLVLGALFVVVFLACGWWRAARRHAA